MGWHAIRKYSLLQGRQAIRSIEVPDNRELPIHLESGGGEHVCDVRATVVQPWLVILLARCQGERRGRTVLLASDSLHADHFRRLRIALLQRRPAA